MDPPRSIFVVRFCHFGATNFKPTWLLLAIVYFSDVVTTPVSYTKLTFLITSSFVCSVLIGTMVHRPDDDLLAFFLLAS
jgi:hypothetical protein